MEKGVSAVEYANLSVRQVLGKLKTSEGGLSSAQAGKRYAQNGPNRLSSKKTGLVMELLAQFRSPLIWILIVATGVSFYFGEVLSATIIIVMIVLGVALNFYQSYTASKAVEELKEIVKTRTTVIRDGEQKEISTEHVTIGDILVLSPGTLICADARVIESKELFISQASLTGESVPAEKTHLASRSTSATLSELKNIAFMGTSVSSGTGLAVVFAVGTNTEFGKISQVVSAPNAISDFEKGVGDFSYLILKTLVSLVIVLFFLNVFMKHDLLESLLFSLAVAVGLTPELLPAIMSLNMAKGSINMAKKGAIVKKLNSIPNFGSMDVLCTDKTGTLTEDHIHLVKYVDVRGKHSEKVFTHAYLNSYFHTGMPNPLDSAIVEYRKVPVPGYKKIDEIPFDFVRRKMSVVVAKGKDRMIITKGAPEDIFRSCKRIGKEAHIQYRALSAEGYRVLAIAVKKVPIKKAYSKMDEHSLNFLGFTVFLDPARKDVKNVLKEMQSMNIEVKILTGDNELVTRKICSDVGLAVKGILLGDDLRTLSDEALSVKVEKTTIFARVSPSQKDRIIHALKKAGHVVGYMGDGINDAPSLKNSDVGISVKSAVDIARESADIVLTHKSLEVLRNGIIEGRKTFGNTIKYITMGLSSNFGNMFSVLGAVLYVPFLPMLPVQIMLNNMLYDFSQITIPGDQVDKEYTLRPKRWNMRFLRHFMWIFGPISSIFDLLTYYLLFGIFHAPAAMFQTGWFIESLATQTLVIHVIRTRKIPFIESKASPHLLISTFAVVIIGWIIPFTTLGAYFGFVPLPWEIMASIMGLVAVYLIVVEMAKRWFYNRYDM